MTDFEVWQSGDVTLYRGDCLEVAASIGDGAVDCVVTDPPYGINTKSDGNGKLNPWADLCNSAFWYSAWIRECRRVLAANGSMWSCLNWRSLVTFQKAACDIGWSIESLMVWDKCWIGPGGPRGLRPSYELVALWVGSDFSIADRGLYDIQRFKWSSQKPHGHPAEKPVDLMAFCIKHGCREGGTVFDPFSGSGTTAEAAIRAGRRFVGCEIDPGYFEIAKQRILAAQRERESQLIPA
jgi:site-specific DNA-methyltransferase (adenine-specific)